MNLGMITVAFENKQTIDVLRDPAVVEALAFLHASIETCAEESYSKVLDLCSTYMCAFIMRILINLQTFDASYLANELHYYGTKFIIDFSGMPESGGDCDE